MSDRRIPRSINPQIAMKSYLDDLLQEVSQVSPLDELKAHETELQPEPASPVVKATRTTSLARQRMEQKKALQALPVQDVPTLPSTFFLPTLPSVAPDIEVVTPSSVDVKELTETVCETSVPETNVEVPAPQVSSPVEPIAVPTETPVVVKTETKTDTEIAQEQVRRSALRQRMMALRDKIKTDRAKASVSAPEVSAPTVEEPSIDKVEQVVQTPDLGAELPNGRPSWAQDRFDCLLFTVAGLKLAVPLVSLGAIHAIDKELTPLVGRPSWFLGLLPMAGRNIRAVDTAQWVMPERYHRELNEAYRFIIRLGDTDWGIACDKVAQSFSLSPDEVKWRTQRSKRPWLAGTVVEHMCALMDVDALSSLLDQAEKTQASPLAGT